MASLALLLHAAFLGGLAEVGTVADKPPMAAGHPAMTVRPVETAHAAEALRPVVEPASRVAPVVVRTSGLAPALTRPPVTPLPRQTRQVIVPAAELATLPAASSPQDTGSSPAASTASPSTVSTTFLAEGELPPPTYRTLLPAPATLHYGVRRGDLSGSGEIRWQRSGDTYALRLEARIAGLTVLSQTSEGVVDAAGLAPTRFLDQRPRRSAQAANFRRDTGTVTFSGPATVWPLLPGSQDQLSWMWQLAGIVAADPERATDGGRIAMVIVGARGDASVRTARFAGRENVETASGSVPALKFVVDGRATYDTSHEIWLDPGHDHVPVRAIQRNAAGESQFDLLLERIDPPS